MGLRTRDCSEKPLGTESPALELERGLGAARQSWGWGRQVSVTVLTEAPAAQRLGRRQEPAARDCVWVPTGPETRPSLCRRPERQGGTAAQKRSCPPPVPAEASRVAALRCLGSWEVVNEQRGHAEQGWGRGFWPRGGLPAAPVPLLRSPGFRARPRSAGAWQEGAGPTRLPCSLLSSRPGSSSPSPKRSESSFSLKEGARGLGGSGGCTGPASSSVRSERSSRTGNSPWTGSRQVSRRPPHPPGCHVTPRGFRYRPSPGAPPVTTARVCQL